MTPEEKAIELIDKYRSLEKKGQRLIPLSYAKKCALIAVYEIIWEIIKYADGSKEFVKENSIWWESVKQEIEKL